MATDTEENGEKKNKKIGEGSALFARLQVENGRKKAEAQSRAGQITARATAERHDRLAAASATVLDGTARASLKWLYYVSRDSIRRFNPQTLDDETIARGAIADVAVHLDENESRSKLFWSTWAAPFQIWSAELDGANARAMITAGGPVTSLVVDERQQRLYWIEGTTKIRHADYNGNIQGGELSIAAPGRDNFWQLSIDPEFRRKLFWTNDRSIWQAGLAGETESGPELLATLSDSPYPIDLAVDKHRMNLYWMDRELSAIQRAYTQPFPVLDLSKAGKVVTLPSLVELPEAWTVEAWFRYPFPRNVGASTLAAADGRSIPVMVQGNHLGIFSSSRGGSRFSRFDVFTLSEGWHHLAAVHSHWQTDFYIDGAKVGDANVGREEKFGFDVIGNHPFAPPNRGPFRVSQPFGTLAEFRAWGYARSPAEIRATMFNSLTGKERGLVGYWGVDPESPQVFKDLTGKGIDGKLVNGACWVPADDLRLPPLPPTRVANLDQADLNYYQADNTLKAFSLCLWLKLAGERDEMSDGDTLIAGAGNGFFVLRKDDTVGVHLIGATQTGVFSEKKLATDSWTHLAWVYAEGETAIYIDGEPAARGKLDPGRLGEVSFGGRLRGLRLQGISGWRVPLDQAQVRERMYLQVLGDEPELFMALPMNDGKGQTLRPPKGTFFASGALQPRQEANGEAGAMWIEDDELVLLKPFTNRMLRFDGKHVMPHNIAGPGASEDITIEVWVNPEKIDGLRTLLSGISADPGTISLRLNKGVPQFGLAVAEDVIFDKTTLPVDTWSHLAVSYSKAAGLVRLYVNGDLRQEKFSPETPSPMLGTFRIGNLSETDVFQGRIGEVRVWGAVRSGRDIRACMGRRLSGAEEDLLGCWQATAFDRFNLKNCAAGAQDITPLTKEPSGEGPAVTQVDDLPTSHQVIPVALFDKSGGSIDCGNNALLQPTQTLTFEAWVRIKGGIGSGFDAQLASWAGGGSPPWRFFLRYNVGHTTLGFTDGEPDPLWQMRLLLLQEKWLHVALTFDLHEAGNNLKLYVDGQLAGAFERQQPPSFDGAGRFFICGHRGEKDVACEMSEVRLWDVTRSGEEIRETMGIRLGTGRREGLAGYWPLDESAGESTLDLSGNGNHGKFQGDAGWSLSHDLFFEEAPSGGTVHTVRSPQRGLAVDGFARQMYWAETDEEGRGWIMRGSLDDGGTPSRFLRADCTGGLTLVTRDSIAHAKRMQAAFELQRAREKAKRDVAQANANLKSSVEAANAQLERDKAQAAETQSQSLEDARKRRADNVEKLKRAKENKESQIAQANAEADETRNKGKEQADLIKESARTGSNMQINMARERKRKAEKEKRKYS